MLHYLYIENIILIEKEQISFQKGLNILTGETGSGKSALLKALFLIAGERGDTSLIRHGSTKGIVEALFELEEFNPFLNAFLNENGIELENNQLIIRREISNADRGRIFLNHRLIQLSFLKKITPYLFHIVSQHASQQLFSLDFHRDILDLYGDLSSLKNEYYKNYELVNTLKTNIEATKREEAQRLRSIDHYRSELEELEEANLGEEEEEILFSEYSLLSNSEEIALKIDEVNQAMSGERNSLLSLIKRQKQLLESISKYDPKLNEFSDSLNNLFLELQELSHSINIYQTSIGRDPHRLTEVNERLTLINRLKKKYGGTFKELYLYRIEAKEKLSLLEKIEDQSEEFEKQLAEKEELTQKLAQQLTQKRTEYALSFQEVLSNELRALNMKNAAIRIAVSLQKPGPTGVDKIEILLTPNLGEQEISLLDHASGGEVARVLLAIQTLLADKKAPALLVFDEIDANIGGETATVVGEKLLQISQNAQVIGITHFPQVASKAGHHLKISKTEKQGRTISQIHRLEFDNQIKSELNRMIGGALQK